MQRLVDEAEKPIFIYTPIGNIGGGASVCIEKVQVDNLGARGRRHG